MNKFKYIFENNLFGVCSRIGEKQFSASSIRMYFIYASFLLLAHRYYLFSFGFWMRLGKLFVATTILVFGKSNDLLPPLQSLKNQLLLQGRPSSSLLIFLANRKVMERTCSAFYSNWHI